MGDTLLMWRTSPPPPSDGGGTGDVLERFGLRVGDLIAGRYRVVDLLGSGGMGVVVGVEHAVLGTPYAAKLLLHGPRAPRMLVERFLREALAVTRLTSPHAVRIFDVAPLPDGGVYILMERLEGSDLKAVLRREGRLPPALAVGWVAQACRAVGEAHALDIVHRDVRPRNLFLIERGAQAGMIKVLDFGIAKLLRDEALGAAQPLTAPGSILGSPYYMSPEQIVSARDADARADVWSLGVTLYELLAGQLPFVGPHDRAIAQAVTTADPVPLSTLRPDVSRAVSDVVMRCLEKDRERRFATATELEGALADAMGADAPETQALATSLRPEPARSRRRPLIVAAVAAAAIGLVPLGIALDRQTAKTAPAASEDPAPQRSSEVVQLAPFGVDPLPASTASDVPPLASSHVHDYPETTNVSCTLAQLACERRLPTCAALLDDCRGIRAGGQDAGGTPQSGSLRE